MSEYESTLYDSMSTSIAAGLAKWGPLAWPLYCEVFRGLVHRESGTSVALHETSVALQEIPRFSLCFVIRARKTREGQRQRVRH